MKGLSIALARVACILACMGFASPADACAMQAPMNLPYELGRSEVVLTGVIISHRDAEIDGAASDYESLAHIATITTLQTLQGASRREWDIVVRPVPTFGLRDGPFWERQIGKAFIFALNPLGTPHPLSIAYLSGADLEDALSRSLSVDGVDDPYQLLGTICSGPVMLELNLINELRVRIALLHDPVRLLTFVAIFLGVAFAPIRKVNAA